MEQREEDNLLDIERVGGHGRGDCRRTFIGRALKFYFRKHGPECYSNDAIEVRGTALSTMLPTAMGISLTCLYIYSR